MWPSYQDFRTLNLSEGRLITEDDEREARRVVVLGFAANRQLFPGQPSIGASLLIKSVPYTVVGVLAEDVYKRQQTHDVAHFFNQLRVRRKLEGVGSVRLQSEGMPNPANGHPAESARFRCV